ncbi:DUF2252 domain-containing protein [Nocardia higoensis]|uniref:DUF2252 domain-containing protein n=1 Tax=Nocardia higoensis TaxID=228599 RepID=UPI0002F8CF4B|nr:DUF2252 domain-containing protein [Nocardia higoensis]
MTPPATTTPADPGAPAESPKEIGRAARRRIGRSELGAWEPAADRRDPIAILEQQARTRVPDLVPIRYARMAAGIFPFLRGAPAVMAADLAATPNTGLTVQLCGDAHPSNFGLYASPERALVFDLNDFDETLPGPFEWDVKRLVAGLAVAARANGFRDEHATRAAVAAAAAYRTAMRDYATTDALNIWYERTDVDEAAALVRKPETRTRLEHTLAAARGRTSLQALRKLTEPGTDGVPRIRANPPLVITADDLDIDMVNEVFTAYRTSLPEERRVLLDHYRVIDAAGKVVGVGSVGTRCFIVLLVERDTGTPLFLQVKEAEQSVLAAHLKPSRYAQQGARVVHGQRLTQAAADIFLGWCTGPGGRHFYWRQLRDMKGSADLTTMNPSLLRRYGELCGGTLARAHARSGDRVAIATYLGKSDVFDRAMGAFALAYADRTAADHQRLIEAVDWGEVRAAEAR